MTPKRLDYPSMLQDAVRSVVRAALAEVAELGMPGEHHFYVHFRTDHPAVELPESLRRSYPEEMTIVLQHQFWGLEVDEKAFSVTLAFGGARRTITVPFTAVTGFVDPAASFELRLGPAPREEGGETFGQSSETVDAPGSDETGGPEGATVVDLEAFRKR